MFTTQGFLSALSSLHSKTSVFCASLAHSKLLIKMFPSFSQEDREVKRKAYGTSNSNVVFTFLLRFIVLFNMQLCGEDTPSLQMAIPRL